MYRRKQFKKHKKHPSEFKKTSYNRTGDFKHNNNNGYNKVRSLSKNSKYQRLSQIDKELADIVFEPEYRAGDKYDKLLLERWRLRYELGL